MSVMRRVAFGSAQLTLSNVVVRLVALATMPLLTRLLPPSAYGTAALATTLISLISYFGLWGADVSYIRSYHSEEPPKGQQVEALTWRFTLSASFVAAMSSLACWGLISRVLSLPHYLGPLVAAGIMLSVCMTMAFGRARLHGRHRAMSVATVAGGVGPTLIAVVIAYCGQRNEFPLILSLLATYLIPVLILGVPPWAILRKPSGLSYAGGKHILGIGAAVVLTSSCSVGHKLIGPLVPRLFSGRNGHRNLHNQLGRRRRRDDRKQRSDCDLDPGSLQAF